MKFAATDSPLRSRTSRSLRASHSEQVGACHGSESNWNGAELLCPLSKVFAIFDVVCSVNEEKSRIFADFAAREDFLSDTYDFVLFGVRRIVGNSINARSGNFISRLIRLRLYLGQCRLLV